MDRMNDDLPPEVAAALARLDARARARAARVDVEGVAARVLERLRQEEAPQRRWWPAPAALRVAAAAVVLAAAGAIATLSVRAPQPVTAMRLPLLIPAADSLDSGQLEAVVKAAGEVRPAVDSAAPAVSSGSYEDLSEQQLETLLASLKGAES